MPPGVPHWVLSTSNAICVGRHFYGASTIRLSIIGIVHVFFLEGFITNEDHLQTRTLLYQLLVFWSMQIDNTDVDGKFNVCCNPVCLTYRYFSQVPIYLC